MSMLNYISQDGLFSNTVFDDCDPGGAVVTRRGTINICNSLARLNGSQTSYTTSQRDSCKLSRSLTRGLLTDRPEISN